MGRCCIAIGNFFTALLVASAVQAQGIGPAGVVSTDEAVSTESTLRYPLRLPPDWPAAIDPALVTPLEARQGAGRLDRAPAPKPTTLTSVLLQQPAENPPAPHHTGLAAVLYETVADFATFPRRPSTWVLLAVGAAGAALSHPADDHLNARLVGSRAVGRFFAPGKWIGSLPVEIGAATGLYVIGRYVLPEATGEAKTNKIAHLGFDLLRATIVSMSLTAVVKVTAQRGRPTGECCSFPSGHAATTFAMASVVERHLGYRAAWPTMLVASYVAASRLHDNRHFLSDVVFGAALGVASGWTVVGRHGRSEYGLMPVAVPGGVMIAFVRGGPSSIGIN